MTAYFRFVLSHRLLVIGVCAALTLLALAAVVDNSGMFATNYDGTEAGTEDGICSNIYCHSNGGTYTGVAKVAGDFTLQTVRWEGKKNTIIGQPTECSSCHGNSVATMAVGDKDNSQTHNAHLNKGYTCNVCHSTTATSNTAVNISGGQHVDGQVDLSLDGAFELTPGDAGTALGGGSLSGPSCTVYCHSNGSGGAPVQTPDWGDADQQSMVLPYFAENPLSSVDPCLCDAEFQRYVLGNKRENQKPCGG